MDISLEKEIQQIRVVDTERNYWFIRTYGGKLYNYFLENGFIGIGFNQVPLQYIKEAKSNDEPTLNRLKIFIENSTTYKKAEATKWANQLISFQQKIKIDDIVIIPSTYSDDLAIGIVESNPYVVQVKETFEFENRLEPYPEKRRKIKWLKTIPKAEFRGTLNGMFFSRTAIKDVTSFSEIIEGNLSSLYIKDEHIYLSIKIDKDEDINAFHLQRFLEALTFLYKEFCKDYGYEENEELFIKIKVQSKGDVFFKALAIGALVSIGGIVGLANDKSVMESLKLAVQTTGAAGVATLAGLALISEAPKLKIENKILGKFEAASKGNALKNMTDFLDARHKRKEEREDNKLRRQIEVYKLLESVNQLKAKTIEDPVTKNQDSLDKPKE